MSTRTIFIVEDNEIYSMMLDYILSKDNTYRFVRFRSGEECLRNLYLMPDIIILDFGLPGMNGYETLVEIKKRRPDLHVITLTDHRDQLLEKRLLQAGADEHILKQGHGELQVIEKIEVVLSKEEKARKIEEKKNKRLRMRRAAYMALALILISIGYYLS